MAAVRRCRAPIRHRVREIPRRDRRTQGDGRRIVTRARPVQGDARSRLPSLAGAAQDLRAVVAEHPSWIAAVRATCRDRARLRKVRAVDDPSALAAFPTGPKARGLIAQRTGAALTLCSPQLRFPRMRSTHALAIVRRGRAETQSTKLAHRVQFLRVGRPPIIDDGLVDLGDVEPCSRLG